MDNVLGAIDVPLSLFSGLNTELAPVDLPEGVSPSNQDIVFLPGSWQTRPGLALIFNSPFNGASILYTKTYVQPNGVSLNLYLDSTGKLWREDVTVTPGVKTQIAQVTPGSRCISVTANGREYFAFSDGIHGLDAPRQYDGTNFDRVTQDGPGNAGSCADFSSTIAVVTATAVVPAVGIVASPNGLSENGLIVTCNTTAPHQMIPGDTFVITSPDAGYNGTFPVLSVPSSNSFTYQVGTASLAPNGSGTVFPLKVEVTTAVPHGLLLGDSVVISGNTALLYNNSQSDGTNTTPGSWQVYGVVDPTHFYFEGISTGTTTGTGGTIVIGGQSTSGVHQMVTLFQTRTGFITIPSPPISFSSAGGLRLQVTNLPIGPSNVIARICAFTGAGGDNFYYIPVPAQNNGLVISTSTVVADNTSTSAVFDFSDNTLFAATGIDIPGRNYFAGQVLSPALGCFAYASRLLYWGLDNKITNFLNMGFDGGYQGSFTHPTGWTVPGSGTLVAAPVDFGFGWQITGTGGLDGQINQPAYQDWEGIPITESGINYSVRLWAKRSSTAVTGNILVDFVNAGTGFVWSVATIPIPSVSSTIGQYYTANFSAQLPAPVPSILLLRIRTSGLNTGATVVLDDIEIIFRDQPYRTSVALASYVIAPEQFDGVTGILSPASDPSPIQCFSILRDTMRLKTSNGMHTTQDVAGTEPSGWPISSFSRTVGAISSRGGDPGRFGSGDTAEDWDLTMSRGGLYIDFGGEIFKISQEIQTLWDRINWNFKQVAWLKNDPVARRAYIGVPLDTSTFCNKLLVWDYREMDSAVQIASSGPVRISYTGRMIATDISRKWTIWNLPMASGELLDFPGNDLEMVFGSANGAIGSNAYYLDSTKLVDDNFGEILDFYVTYAFLNHEAEVALGTGLHRKLYAYMTMYVNGTGLIKVTPYVDTLDNPMTPTKTISPVAIQPDFLGGATMDGNGLVTIQTAQPHGLSKNTYVAIAGVTVSGYNTPPAAPVQVVSTPDRRTFTYQLTPLSLAPSGGGTSYRLEYLMLTADQTFDFEWGLNVLGERAFFRIEAVPLPGTTAAYINMNKMIVSIRQDPWMPIRGAF